ncbi:MAG TPA: AEC family transporter [Polyangiaceae bacterium]
MLSALFTVFVLLVAGYLLRRLGRVPDNAADVLNRFVIDICVPATILRLVPKLQLEPSLIVLVIVPWAMVGLAYLLVRAAARPFALDRTHRTVLFLALALGNTSFLGFPLCGALLGERAIPLAAVYDQLGSFLILSIVAPIALGSVTAGARPRPARIARQVLTFPPMIALLIALIPFSHPPFLDALLATAAAALVPLAMVAVGLKLRLTPPRPLRVFLLGLTSKLLVLPCAAWLLVRTLGAPPLVVQVAVLETAMPTMITAGALMMAYGVGTELAAAFVGWGLILSLATVPAWSFVLR